MAGSDADLLVPDFWLNEACNVFWLQVRRKLFTPDEAREALALLRAQVEPTPPVELGLHDIALEIGLAINHSTYDTLYVAFALVVGRRRLSLPMGLLLQHRNPGNCPICRGRRIIRPLYMMHQSMH